MRLNHIRASFLDYFASKGHKISESSPIIPYNDPTLMFTGAGMVPFKNCFTGLEPPPSTKVASAQKCVRAGGKHNDLENVGYTARHHTFFEMLGNFSFGDYFKEEAITLAWDYLTQELKLPVDKLHITVYHEDIEALNIWKKVSGFSEQRIIKIATSDNFWAMGDTGPCGPCSEIFYDHGEKYQGGLPGTEDADGDRYVEIWNLVFMQYDRQPDSSMAKLPKPCIDTGMGLERIAAVLQGTHHNYEIDLFQKLICASQEFSNNLQELTSHRVIADHLRCAAFLIAGGVLPSNEGRGYVLRRIMRRAMRHAHMLGVKEPLLYKLVPTIVEEMKSAYTELEVAQTVITSSLKLEEEMFRETLGRGLKLLNTAITNLGKGDILSGDVAFNLYDTYGFPLDLTKDILKAEQIGVDESEFETCMAAQRQRARASWAGSGESFTDKLWYEVREKTGSTDFIGYLAHNAEAVVQAIIVDGKLEQRAANCQAIIILNQTPFYGESGGQVGDTGYINDHKVVDTKKFLASLIAHIVMLERELKVGDIVHARIDEPRRARIRANHSATHLLHKALRKHLGEHVTQKGSIVTNEKLRFDFSHPERLTNEQLTSIERDINQAIIANHPVYTELSSADEAIKKGAMALFGEKYGDEVRAVAIAESLELCGGTHVHYTGEIGLLKIIHEESIASGIRRIEATTGLEALAGISDKQHILEEIKLLLKCGEKDILEKLQTLLEDKKKLEKESAKLRVAHTLTSNIEQEQIGDIHIIVRQLERVTPQDLKSIAIQLAQRLPNSQGIIIISSLHDGRVSILVYVSPSLTARYNASSIIKAMADEIDGQGGGKPELAQAGGTKIAGIGNAIARAKTIISST